MILLHNQNRQGTNNSVHKRLQALLCIEHTGMAFDCSITQPDHPFTAPFYMITGFFDGLFADSGQFSDWTFQQFPELQQLKAAEIKLTENGFRPIPIRSVLQG